MQASKLSISIWEKKRHKMDAMNAWFKSFLLLLFKTKTNDEKVLYNFHLLFMNNIFDIIKKNSETQKSFQKEAKSIKEIEKSST